MNAPTKTAQVGVLLLHGLCSTPDELLPVQQALRQAGYAVYAPIIAGYSFENTLSEQRAQHYTHWLRAVLTQIEHIRQQHERVVLVGISAGASLALGATIEANAVVDGMVLLSTPLVYDGWAIPRTQCLLPLVLYTPLGRWWQYRECPPYGVKNERVRAWIERELQQRRVSSAGSAVLGVGHLREHDRLRRWIRQHLSQVSCPQVLAIHAREDEVASLRNIELLQHGLASTQLRTLVLNNSYHMISIDNDRQQVARETLSFVAAIAAVTNPTT